MDCAHTRAAVTSPVHAQTTEMKREEGDDRRFMDVWVGGVFAYRVAMRWGQRQRNGVR